MGNIVTIITIRTKNLSGYTMRQLMYWIFLDNDPNPPTDKETYCQDAPMTNLADLPPFNPGFTPVGHIALDWVDYEGDASLASKENHRMFASGHLLNSRNSRYHSQSIVYILHSSKQAKCRTWRENHEQNRTNSERRAEMHCYYFEYSTYSQSESQTNRLGAHRTVRRTNTGVSIMASKSNFRPWLIQLSEIGMQEEDTKLIRRN